MAQLRAEASGLTEDLRGPLSVVSGYASLLRQRWEGVGAPRRLALLDAVLSELGGMRDRLDRDMSGR